MDSSYGNGGQNIPGAKPGVIASGPDAPDIPGVTLESENPNGVLSKISRKPSNSGSVVVDGGGGPKRSNRKGLVFVGVALIGIALIAGIVAVMLMGKGGGNNGGVGGEVKTLREAFSNVANYLLAGDVNIAANLDEANIDNAAFVEIAKTASYEEQNAYFDTANNHIATLRNFASGNDDLIDNIASLEKLLSAIKDVSAVSYTNILADKYMEDMKSGIKDYQQETNISSEDSYIANAMTTRKSLITKIGELYNSYYGNSCIRDKNFDDTCIDQLLVDNTEILNEFNGVTDLKLKLRKNDETLFNTTLVKLKSISEVVK